MASTTTASLQELATPGVTVKDRRCLVIDPGNQDVRLKLHWVLYNVPDDDVRAAFAPYGKVTEVSKEKWRAQGCAEKGSTTRTVSLKLKAGVSIEDIPHQLRVASDLALVVVPGRPPMCLRCHTAGHVRRECRVPRCSRCRRYGHNDRACVKTYASVAGPAGGNDISEHLMDEMDAEEAASSGGGEASTLATSGASGAAVGTPEEKPSAEVHGQDSIPTAVATTANGVVQEKPSVQPGAQATPTGARPEGNVLPGPAVLSPHGQGAEAMDTVTVDKTSAIPKRQREDSDGQACTGGSPSPDEPPPKAAPLRRMPFRPKPNIPPDRKPAATEPS